MRSFHGIYLVLFIFVYILMSAVVAQGLKKLFLAAKSPNTGRRLVSVYLILSSLILVTFIILFIFPHYPEKPAPYKLFFRFNVILIADILTKLIISVSSFIYFIRPKSKKRKPIVLLAGIILSVGVAGSIALGAAIGKNRVTVREVELEFTSLPQSFNGFKLVQISDLHIGSFSKQSDFPDKSVKLIRVQHPGLILFTGDLVNNFGNEAEGWQAAFSGLDADFGLYSILGNHDYGDYTNWPDEREKDENFRKIISAHEKIGFKLLRNSFIPLTLDGDTIYLIGVENWGHPPFPQYADMGKALQGIPVESFKILMTHDPAHWETKIRGKENIQLTLSGHTHGLQWGIKPAGIEFSLICFGRHNWGGLYSHNGQYLYVNRGLGTIGMNMRLDMPAEITVITLKKK